MRSLAFIGTLLLSASAHAQDAKHPAPPDPEQPKAFVPSGRFEFGSYGRVRVASDLRGRTGRDANVVSQGSRLDEESYAELEFRREDSFRPNVHGRVVATLALFPPFFHFSGSPTQHMGVRNLYAQATLDKTTLWAGSRMLRGDDLYLLNFWPLDNQNTVGGGVGTSRVWKNGHESTVHLHVGMQRLESPEQFQTALGVAPFGAPARTVTTLDRPRTIETVKFLHKTPLSGGAGMKWIAYGEAHQISAGVAKNPESKLEEPRPNDSGFVLGLQATYFTGKRDSHVHLVVRHARGLGAYDPLASPTTFDQARTATSATSSLLAFGGNVETYHVGLLFGGYVRLFRDAQAGKTSLEKFDEGIVSVRPHVFVSDLFGVAFEGSYQGRRFAFLDPETDAPLYASVFRFGVIPYFSPTGRGVYKRPQLRLMYNASFRGAGARALSPAIDPLSSRPVEHFVGIGAEWWFNSSSYP